MKCEKEDGTLLRHYRLASIVSVGPLRMEIARARVCVSLVLIVAGRRIRVRRAALDHKRVGAGQRRACAQVAARAAHGAVQPSLARNVARRVA